jgi:hypothetical protein
MERIFVLASQERFDRACFEADQVARPWDFPGNHSLPPAPPPPPRKPNLAPPKGLACSQEAHAEVLRLADTGLHNAAIVTETGLSVCAVARIRRHADEASGIAKKGAPRRQLTPDEVQAIREMLDAGEALKTIASASGVSFNLVLEQRNLYYDSHAHPVPVRRKRERRASGVSPQADVYPQSCEAPQVAVCQPVRPCMPEPLRTDVLMWASRMRAMVFDGPVTGPRHSRRIRTLIPDQMRDMLCVRFSIQAMTINATPNRPAISPFRK